MALADEVDLGLEHVADELVVGAVYDQLHAALEEIVVYHFHVGFQGEEALFLGFLGQGHESGHQLGGVLALGGEHFLEHLGGAYHGGEREVHEQRAERAAHDDEEGLDVHERLEPGDTFLQVDRAQHEAHENHDTAECRYIHRSPGGTFTCARKRPED